MRDPVRDLPRTVHVGILTVTICFVLTNIAYYIIIPWNVLEESDAIAVVSPLLDFLSFIVKDLPSHIPGGRETNHGYDRWPYIRNLGICVLSWRLEHRRLHERNLGCRFGTSWLPPDLPHRPL